jgi:hypothetical protein
MCPSGAPHLPLAEAKPNTEFSVPAGKAVGKLHIEAILHYRKIDQFLLNYVMGDKSGLTAPVVDIASASAEVCIAKAADGAKCQ